MSRLIAGFACAVLVSGCQTLHSPMANGPMVDGPGAMLSRRQAAGFQEEALLPGSPGDGSEAAATSDDTSSRPAGRLHVYSGKFRISTADINESADQLIAIVQDMEGYLQSRDDAVVVVRVPGKSFRPLIDRLGDCGTIVSRSIQTDDVTNEFQDLELRLGVLESSHLRLMALMDQAGSLDELLKLEEQLAKLTTEIESLKGSLKKLNQEVTYSTVRVNFAVRSVVGQRKSIPFDWVNQLGAERVMTGFRADFDADTNSDGMWQKLFAGTPPMDVPEGFLVVESDRHELQAVSPDDARVWYREFDANKTTDVEFWAKAIQTHLVDHLGYRLIDHSEVQSSRSQTGHQMLFEVDSDQGPMRYLLTVSRKSTSAWSRHGTVQVLEFAAPARLFAEYVQAVGEASPFQIAVHDPAPAGAVVLVSER